MAVLTTAQRSDHSYALTPPLMVYNQAHNVRGAISPLGNNSRQSANVFRGWGWGGGGSECIYLIVGHTIRARHNSWIVTNSLLATQPPPRCTLVNRGREGWWWRWWWWRWHCLKTVTFLPSDKISLCHDRFENRPTATKIETFKRCFAFFAGHFHINHWELN